MNFTLSQFQNFVFLKSNNELILTNVSITNIVCLNSSIFILSQNNSKVSFNELNFFSNYFYDSNLLNSNETILVVNKSHFHQNVFIMIHFEHPSIISIDGHFLMNLSVIQFNNFSNCSFLSLKSNSQNFLIIN